LKYLLKLSRQWSQSSPLKEEIINQDLKATIYFLTC
jgi:hypothetical protein